MGKFERFQDKAGQHRFRLKADNGEPILASEGYVGTNGVNNGIDSVKKNAPDDKNYQRKETPAGWSFNLKAGNGEIIGTSEVYTSESGRENGIDAVKRVAPSATVVDA